jgi:5-deoxy-glucuronate isomerase
MHIPPFDNRNAAIVGIDDPDVPLTYLNIVRLTRGETFTSDVPGYETALVPADGTIDVEVVGPEGRATTFPGVGARSSIWEGDPSAVYVPGLHGR